MTESLWNKYDISRKSPEVTVKRSPKAVRRIIIIIIIIIIVVVVVVVIIIIVFVLV